MGAAITVKNLSVRYVGSNAWALRDVNLGVREGEMLVLMGLSGCGKSTLLKVLAGLMPWVIPGTVEGYVEVAGINVLSSGYKALAGRVGIVYQNPEVQVITRSVFEELAMAPENLGLPKDEVVERVYSVARSLGLEDYLSRDPQTLSGGEKQLVAIASVLTMRPRILLLDEPTSMLDHAGTRMVLELVTRLKREQGLTIVAAEHRVEWAVDVADRVAVMSEGKVVMDGPPEEVFSRIEEVEKYGVRPPGASEVAYKLTKLGVDIGIPVKLDSLARKVGVQL
ncbi:MAG: ATP-binding cassette domain-containing protein [Infirmifilum sp.]